MPNLTAGQSATVNVPKGQVLTIGLGAEGNVVANGINQAFYFSGNKFSWPDAETVNINVISGSMNYQVWLGSTVITSVTTQATFSPITDDYAGIIGAYNLAVANGGGIISLKPITYNIGSNSLPISSNITYQGTGWNLVYLTIPDSYLTLFNTNSGTVIKGDGTNIGIGGNTTDLGSAFASQTLLSNAGLTNISIKNIGFSNCLYGVKIGGSFNAGAWYSEFKNLVAIGCGWGFWFETMIHCFYDKLYAFNNTTGQIKFRSSCSSIFAPGNCDIGEICATTATNLLSRGIEIDSINGGTLGGIGTSQIIQCNRFNNPTFNNGNAVTITGNGTTTVNVTGTGFTTAQLAVGMPFSVTANALGFNQNRIYIVRSIIDANNITVAVDNVTAIFAPTAGTNTMICKGFPPLQVIGYDTSQAGLGNVALLDLEAGGTCKLYMEGGSISYTVNVGPGVFAGAESVSDICVRRNASQTFIGGVVGLRYDLDASGAAGSRVFGNVGAAYNYTPLSFGYSSANNRNALNIGGVFGCESFTNKQSAFGPFTYPESPMGVRTKFFTTTTNFATGNSPASLNGYTVFSGTTPASTIWNYNGGGAELVGFVQIYKNQSNTAGATLTVTLDAGSGTFDGLTAGTSSGKSIILQPATGSALGGVLELVFVQTGASAYGWSVKSLSNGAFV